MKLKSFILLFFLAKFCFAQKVEIVKRSDYRHNYAVGRFVYIESAADTSRLKFIATLKIHADNYPYIVSNFIERFKMEGKELGANAFRLQSFYEKDSSITLCINTYFAPEKFFDENDAKKQKNKIFLFSVERRQGFNQYFYLNDSLTKFSSFTYFELNPVENEKVQVSSIKHPLPGFKTASGYKFKTGKDAEFRVIGFHTPNSNGIITTLAVVAVVAVVAGGGVGGVRTGGTPIPTKALTSKKDIATLPYTYGRILIDIYEKYKP